MTLVDQIMEQLQTKTLSVPKAIQQDKEATEALATAERAFAQAKHRKELTESVRETACADLRILTKMLELIAEGHTSLEISVGPESHFTDVVYNGDFTPLKKGIAGLCNHWKLGYDFLPDERSEKHLVVCIRTQPNPPSS